MTNPQNIPEPAAEYQWTRIGGATLTLWLATTAWATPPRIVPDHTRLAPKATLTVKAQADCQPVLWVQGSVERLLWVDRDGELCEAQRAQSLDDPAFAASVTAPLECRPITVVHGGVQRSLWADEQGNLCGIDSAVCRGPKLVRGADHQWVDLKGRVCRAEEPPSTPPSGCQEVVLVRGGAEVRQWVDAVGQPCLARPTAREAL